MDWHALCTALYDDALATGAACGPEDLLDGIRGLGLSPPNPRHVEQWWEGRALHDLAEAEAATAKSA